MDKVKNNKIRKNVNVIFNSHGDEHSSSLFYFTMTKQNVKK